MASNIGEFQSYTFESDASSDEENGDVHNLVVYKWTEQNRELVTCLLHFLHHTNPLFQILFFSQLLLHSNFKKKYYFKDNSPNICPS